jgi:hypothetical protein
MADSIALSGVVTACTGNRNPRITLLITASPCHINVKISRGTSNATSHLKSKKRVSRSGRRRLRKLCVVVTDIYAFTSFLKDYAKD